MPLSKAEKLLQEALALHRQGNLSEAEARYKGILESSPNQPDAIHHLGIIAHQRKDYKLAASLIHSALDLHPIPQMAENLALTISAAGEKVLAVDVLKSWIKKFPHADSLVRKLATLQSEAGDLKAARETLVQLLGQVPSDADLVLSLANVERELGNTQKALECYLKALDISPDFEAAHSNLGVFYTEISMPDDAIKHNRRAIELQPRFAPYHYNLGNSFLAANRPGEALPCFEAAIKLDDKSENIWLNLGVARRLTGDLQGAMDANRRALELNPNMASPYINQASILLVLKRYEELLKFLEIGLRLDPSNYVAWGTQAEALRQLGRLQEARMSAHRAIKLAPTFGRSALILANIEEQANCYQDAERALRHAFCGPSGLEFRATDADGRVEARLRLSNLMALTDRKSEAESVFGVALALLAEKRPGLAPSRTESETHSPKLVLLQPIGRAGSLFLHSLIDGHPEVSTTPAALLKGFFGEGVWEGLCPGFSHQGWRKTLVERFCQQFEPLFDAASPKPVPGNPLGEPTEVGRGFGLCEMGAERNQVLTIDRDKFKSCMLADLDKRSEITASEFFCLVHKAYDFALGRLTPKSVLFFHIHNPSVNELAGCVVANPHLQFLNIVREPLQGIESWMSMFVIGRTDPEKLLLGYQDAVDRFQLALQQASHLVYERYPSATIRLEDLKRRTDLTLSVLSKWLDISDNPCLRESTYSGLVYQAPSNVPVKGFEPSNLDRKPGFFFSEHDQRVMNLLLYPIAVQYGYRDPDPAYLSEELAWYKPKLDEPLDFEKNILRTLAAMNYGKDATGPRRHFRSLAERCINLLERFGTYPAMAPWLKVDSHA